MKILLIGLSKEGHRGIYLEYIAESIHPHAQVVLLCPESCIDSFTILNKHPLKTSFHKKRSLPAYLKMLWQIRNIAVEESADIIHFLDADDFYRYFGIGLSCLSQFKVIMTFHHLYINNWRKNAILHIMENIDCSVVHTAILAEYFSALVKHSVVKHIEYPAFGYDSLQAISPALAKERYSLPSDKIIIGLLGGALKYKGYHFLLDNLSELRKDKYHFLFVGSEGDYTDSQIRNALEQNSISGTVKLKRLSTYDFHCAIQACDIILLPYTKEFNGASGPLAEGVCAGKLIIGSDYESLGASIQNHHIGYTFKVENGHDLIDVLNHVENTQFIYDTTALQFQKSLRPEYFGNSYLKIYQSLIRKNLLSKGKL